MEEEASMTPVWFEDDRLWEGLAPMLVSAEARAAGVDEVEAIAALAGRPATAVLDLGCGGGRHSVPFAKRGCRVTGVDKSAFLLRHARDYAAAEGVEVRWVHDDMRRFVEPDSFDLALSLLTSFGYFDDPSDNLRVLENARASLRPGGALVLDVMGKETLARIYQPCAVLDLPDGGMFVQRRTVVDDWARMENDWSLVRGGEVVSFRFRHWLYSAAELRAMVRDAGFETISVFGDLRGAPYGTDANRLVIRAYKSTQK